MAYLPRPFFFHICCAGARKLISFVIHYFEMIAEESKDGAKILCVYRKLLMQNAQHAAFLLHSALNLICEETFANSYVDRSKQICDRREHGDIVITQVPFKVPKIRKDTIGRVEHGIPLERMEMSQPRAMNTIDIPNSGNDKSSRMQQTTIYLSAPNGSVYQIRSYCDLSKQKEQCKFVDEVMKYPGLYQDDKNGDYKIYPWPCMYTTFSCTQEKGA